MADGAGYFPELSRIIEHIALRPRRAGKTPGTISAIGTARGADRRPEIHDRLGVVAGAHRIGEFCRETADLRLGFRHRRFDAAKAGQDALDIAVNNTGRLVEGGGKDGVGGIFADARQCPQRVQPVRKVSAHLVRNDAGTGMEIAGAGVIAQPGPFAHHILTRRTSQILDPRP